VLDEERFKKFKQGQYYPANIGDVLVSKYQIVSNPLVGKHMGGQGALRNAFVAHFMIVAILTV
jgi:hypothetical protein